MQQIILGGDSLWLGRGAVKELGTLQAKRAFIVTGGSSMKRYGFLEQAEVALRSSGCEVYLHEGVPANPDTETVLAGVQAMREFQPDLVLAMGGGSPIDAAKVMTLFYEYPELTFAAAKEGRLPQKRQRTRLVVAPSTSGTGSEVTWAAVVTFREDEIKIGLKSNAFIPDIAILDPELTLTMPAAVAAETGMDAVTHAVESYLNKKRNPFSDCLAKEAVAGLLRHLGASCGGDEEAREEVHYLQCMAGLAFHNTGLGLSHGIAHAIGGRYGLGHGLINAIALPYVLHYNRRDDWAKVREQELAKAAQVPDLAEALLKLRRTVAIPHSFADVLSLREWQDGLDGVTAKALLGSTQVNPAEINAEEMRKLLNMIYHGRLEDVALI